MPHASVPQKNDKRAMNEAIHICYGGNRRVFPGLLLSALSIIKHTDRPVRLYVLSMDLHEQDACYLPFSEQQMEVLNAVLREKNPESGALLIDVGDAYRRSLAGGKNKKSYYTPYATLRLYLNELDGLPDKLLYLDIDTMCRSDVSELYDTDVSCCEFAGVPDRLGKFFVNRHYCNSGVLLLNMKRIRENKLFERVRDYVASHRMFTPDQSALNKLAERKLLLPRKFNEQSKPSAETVIKHFCRDVRFLPFFHTYNVKQWHREKVHNKLKIHDFDDIYEQYDKLAERYACLGTEE